MALFMAGGILLIVGSTMGEDGPVTRLAAVDAGDAQRFKQAYAKAPAHQPASSPAQGSAGPSWFAPEASAPARAAPARAASSAIPVYRYEKVHIEVPQQVIDPAVAATSRIR